MDSPDQPLKHTFSLHLPGLLKVLAEHLYSNRNVGVRELIQNAMDSCTRRQIQEQDGRYQPRVELDVDSEAGTLSIFDNGSGLNRDEIHQFLSTIGRGYTRVLREDLAFSAPEDADQLIGQFGLGFLSAFLLASRVEVVTRSTDGSGALRWSSAGDENYEVEDAQRESPGTTVVLHLKIQANYLLDQNVTSKIITKFADFLPTPIYWSGETTPLNRTQPPWLDQNPGHEIKMYINDRFGDQSGDPLLIVPLENWPVPAGKEQITVPITAFCSSLQIQLRRSKSLEILRSTSGGCLFVTTSESCYRRGQNLFVASSSARCCSRLLLEKTCIRTRVLSLCGKQSSSSCFERLPMWPKPTRLYGTKSYLRTRISSWVGW